MVEKSYTVVPDFEDNQIIWYDLDLNAKDKLDQILVQEILKIINKLAAMEIYIAK